MPKWADRARKASTRSRENWVARSFRETVVEATTVAKDIQFIMESSGASREHAIGYDDDSIAVVEKFYRSAAKQDAFESGIENFERLLSLYVGQALIEHKAAAWARYEGTYHVACPIVIRLSDGRHVDVFLFCSCLHQKQVSGSQNGRALIRFIETIESVAFP